MPFVVVKSLQHQGVFWGRGGIGSPGMWPANPPLMVRDVSRTQLPNLLTFFLCLFCLVWFSPVNFSDCKGNDKLHYEVSNPYFRVNNEGGLVAVRNVTAVGKTLFVHARTPHAEDMAELVIVGGKDVQGSLQVTAVGDELGPRRNSGVGTYLGNGSLVYRWPTLFCCCR